MCVSISQRTEHVAVCVPLSPVPLRARAGLFARACVTPSIRTGIRGVFFHFFIAAERACDGDCDVVSSRLQARVMRVRRARAGEREERARLHTLLPFSPLRGTTPAGVIVADSVCGGNSRRKLGASVAPERIVITAEVSFLGLLRRVFFTFDTIIMPVYNYLNGLMSQF